MIERPRLPGASNRLEACIDTALDKERFEGLISTAWEVCLTQPRTIAEVTPLSAEQQIAYQLGVRGLAVALDISNPHHDTESFLTHFRTTDRAEQAIRNPVDYNTSINPEIAAQIEAFGAALLEEAFYCLSKPTRQRALTIGGLSPEEQLATLKQLYREVQRIGKNKATFTDDSDTINYHPARLSPKLLGKFEESAYEPTCLMRSILVASFLEKSGLDYLHCGVVETTQEKLIRSLSGGLIDTLYKLNEQGISPLVAEAFAQNASNMLSNPAGNGYHANCVTRLNDGSWVIIDPNYNTFERVDHADDKNNIADAYSSLSATDQIIHGSEMAISLELSKLNVPLIAFAQLCLAQPLKSLDEASLREILTDNSHVDTVARLKQLVYQSLKFGANLPADSDESTALNMILSFIESLSPSDGPTVIDDSIEAMIARFVMWKSTSFDVINRCLIDPNYLNRRIQDCQTLVPLTLIQMARALSNCDPHSIVEASFDNFCSESTLEAGMPHYRIGISVLSDFDDLLKSGLSTDFWLSYWGSRIPITQQIVRAESDSSSARQAAMAQRSLGIVMDLLPYRNQYGTVFEAYDTSQATDQL